VDGFGPLRPAGDVGGDALEDEQAVLLDEARVDQSAFEVGVALGEQRGGDFVGFERGQLELLRASSRMNFKGSIRR
jgi:hypothetical protein